MSSTNDLSCCLLQHVEICLLEKLGAKLISVHKFQNESVSSTNRHDGLYQMPCYSRELEHHTDLLYVDTQQSHLQW